MTTTPPEDSPSPFGDGVVHSHPEDADPEGFEVVTVACSACGTEHRFTVPKSHLATGVRVKWNCPPPCDTDQFTEGLRPEDAQVTVTLGAEDLAALEAGRAALIPASDGGSAAEAAGGGAPAAR